MAIDSDDLAEVKAAYRAATLYHLDGDPAKARALITAGENLLLMLAERMEKSSGSTRHSIQLNLTLIEKRIARAEEWLAIHGGAATPSGITTAGNVRYLSFEGFRS